MRNRRGEREKDREATDGRKKSLHELMRESVFFRIFTAGGSGVNNHDKSNRILTE